MIKETYDILFVRLGPYFSACLTQRVCAASAGRGYFGYGLQYPWGMAKGKQYRKAQRLIPAGMSRCAREKGPLFQFLCMVCQDHLFNPVCELGDGVLAAACTELCLGAAEQAAARERAGEFLAVCIQDIEVEKPA